MNKHIAPMSDDFAALFRGYERQAWRLETLQQYGASGEDEPLRRFLADEPRLADPEKQAWIDTIRYNVSAGRSIGRVHAVVEPLSDYMRFELSWGYADNVAAGEDIRILPMEQWAADMWRQDFWLFDEQLYLMHYAHDGTWLDVEHVTDPGVIKHAVRTQRLALDNALPYEQFMRRHPDLVNRASV